MLRIRVKVNRRLQEAFSSAECVVLVTEFTFFLVHIPGVLLGQGADWKFIRSDKSMVHDLQKGLLIKPDPHLECHPPSHSSN